MLPTIMSRGPIDLWTRTPRFIAPFSASAPSHHNLSSADFITNIAESDSWYTQVERRELIWQLDRAAACRRSVSSYRGRRGLMKWAHLLPVRQRRKASAVLV